MPCAPFFNPVVGCNGVEYSNPCVAQVSGVTSWTNQSGFQYIRLECETGGFVHRCLVEIFELVSGQTLMTHVIWVCAKWGIYGLL